MNDWENYETQTNYNDALYGKVFAFQFVNSFTSLYYIAFLKDNWEGCVEDNCTKELSLQISVLFITFIFLNCFEIGIPLI